MPRKPAKKPARKPSNKPVVLPVHVSGKLSGTTKGKIASKGGRPTKIIKAKISGDVKGSYWPSSKDISISGNTKIKGKARQGRPPYPRNGK
jgi:hypothetical protein